MFWIIDNFDIGELMWLVLFPIIALVLQHTFSKKTIKYILIIFSILILPVFTGYDFILSWFYEFCATVILGSLFSLFLKGKEKNIQKIIPSLLISISLLIILAYIGFFQAFGGHEKTANKCKKGNYAVEYRISQGFAGKPYKYYAVNHTPFFGLFNKMIQGKSISMDKNSNCIITFEKAKVEFDKCNFEITKTP